MPYYPNQYLNKNNDKNNSDLTSNEMKTKHQMLNTVNNICPNPKLSKLKSLQTMGDRCKVIA